VKFPQTKSQYIAVDVAEVFSTTVKGFSFNISW